MTFASILFGTVIATLIGAIFHLWKGGPFKIYLLIIASSWLGFWCGQIVGSSIGWKRWNYGQLYLVPAILGSILVTFVGYWLSISTQKARRK